MRIVFMGTPDFAIPALLAICEAGHEVLAVYTQPPREAGRGMNLRKSPVHEVAEEAAIPVLTPESLKAPGEAKRFGAIGADAAVVVAYGLILPTDILEAPPRGVFNIHASLLPHWRGAAPINRAVMAGDSVSGVSIMRLTEGLDAGPVCLAGRLKIGPEMTAGELHDALAPLGAELMVKALAALEEGQLSCRPQNDAAATYAPKLDPREMRINWRLASRDVHDRIRGLSPYPGAWFEIERGGKRERIKVLRSASAKGAGPAGTLLDDALTIACGKGAVRLTEVQRAGKTPMPAEEFLRGVKLKTGTVLA
ncbi:MAG TPA: methionyl-tRNA formyltransferase [Methyloceanibacter sp.]|nr:methionyl-tRNA formyltransferase [Methyloceanibacter sp.]